MARRTLPSMTMALALVFAVLPMLAGGAEPHCGDDSYADSACDESRIVLSLITVTATRRESPIERIPVSVTVLSGDILREMGAAGFEDYARSVPGLSFSDLGFGGEKYVIRGITTSVFADARATTAVYLDETPVTPTGFFVSSSAPDPLLVDVNRIEVLRGPQGTMFGSGSMGGAIRIITNQPNRNAFESFAEATLTSTKHGGPGYDVRAMLNAPLADGQAAIRAVAYYRDPGGWIDNTLLGQKDVNNKAVNGLRLAGAWSGSDRLTVNGKIIYQDRHSDGSNVDEGEPPWTQQRFVEEPNQDKWMLINFDVDYSFKWGQLISTTSWLDRQVDHDMDNTAFFKYTFFPWINPKLDTTVTVVGSDDREEFVQEFRLFSTSDSRLDWLLGLFYQQQDSTYNQDFPAPGFDQQTGGLAALFGAPDNLFVGQSDRSLTQTAVFGELIWKPGDKWESSAGGRWFSFDHENATSVYGLLNGGPTYEESSSTETGFTPKLGLSYFVDPDLTLYGTIASGYRPGGPNETVAENFPACREELAWKGLSSIPRSYESDSLWSYELGLKSNWADQRVFLNAAVYYIDWSDIQTSVGLNCGAGWVENAGAATSKGIEIELAAYAMRNLALTFNGAYTDARLSEDLPGLEGLNGDRLPGVPEYALGGSLTWFFALFEGVTSWLRADYQYVGSSHNALMIGRQETPSHSLTNVRLSFRKNRWETSVFVNNLFANRAIVTVNYNPAGDYVTTARPFTVGVSARFEY